VTNIPVAPGQVATIPIGWWHWEIASKDSTYLFAIFEAPYPGYIFESDILNKALAPLKIKPS